MPLACYAITRMVDMSASYPKPDGAKRNRNPPAFGWVYLPTEHNHCPKLPGTRKWHPETRRLWRELWRRPQASQWDQTGLSLRMYIGLWDDHFKGDVSLTQIAPELRQIENLHGLSPKALLQLRWRLPGSSSAAAAIEAVSASPVEQVTSLDQRRRVQESLRKQIALEALGR